MSDKSEKSHKPPIGDNPFAREVEANTGIKIEAGTGSLTFKGMSADLKTSVAQNLESEWFEQQRVHAENGIMQTGLDGWMEVRFALDRPTRKSPRELLEAVQAAEIKTFGWPIGITLQSKDEWRPKPTDEGINAEVAIEESKVTGRNSYDYWALTRGGDFYLLQSFFEDMRGRNLLFFNTRIVRVTEALLFAQDLCAKLEVAGEVKLKGRITHKGLKGRELATSSPNRMLFEKRVSQATTSKHDFEVEVGAIREEIVPLVRAICEPMFELFDYAQFAQPIYEDIVYKFMDGIVT